MSTEGVDTSRRRFLTLAASGMGVVGGAAVVWPILASLKPSAKAQAAGAPATVDLATVEMGQKISTTWRGKAIWVVRRTPEMLASLKKVESKLTDPESKNADQPAYIKGEARAINPELLVLIGSCTHLGCIPTFRPDHPAPDVMADWEGGFFCPCHGSKFDLSGRVFNGSPAPVNLRVPPYNIQGTTLTVGEDPTAA
jgi:ubiquinol-cytochrome c reductase iron-sulfur subunit